MSESNISAKIVMQLRENTSAALMDCKRALEESSGDLAKAEKILREKGIAKADKKANREASDGAISAYIHMEGKIGVLAEVNCETDFVAKTDSFKELVKDLCLHIAAANPKYLTADEVPADELEKEKEIFRKQMKDKPDNVIEKIIEGKIKKYLSEICLMEQNFVKDPELTIEKFVKSKIAELGENIIIRRFTRYALGEA